MIFIIICLVIVLITVYIFCNKKVSFTSTLTYEDGTDCTISNPDPYGTYHYIADTCSLVACDKGYQIGDTSCVLMVAGDPCTSDYCPVNGICVYDEQLICNIKKDKPCVDGYAYSEGMCYQVGSDCVAAGLYGYPIANANYTVVADEQNYLKNCEFNCDTFYKADSTNTSCNFLLQGSCTVPEGDPGAVYSYDSNGNCVASSCKNGYTQYILNGPCVGLANSVVPNPPSNPTGIGGPAPIDPYSDLRTKYNASL